ncbi:uncharacterized protein LOC120357389 [Solenopsis invicta]|uniref:uncharacterized protein LOC120357389 n=1 Tax=Solenopsis invicta TaxID=13686 RepID=UPI00193E6147|nr:uncharacterized protein LOC120357389 [Solenopsis invicta]
MPFTNRRKLHLTAPMVDGTRVGHTTEVKYLGALHTCRRLFGRNWGPLTPNMIHWSYTAIIRPMVTYAAVVWLPKTKQRTAQQQLQKIQRLACLSITGAIKTCPTAATEALLDVLPLHLQSNRPYEYPHDGRFERHSSTPYGLDEDHIQPRAQLRSCLYRQRDVGMGRAPFKRDALQWYTDGSKAATGNVGVDISGPNCRLSISLGKTPSVFQAEVYAINSCVSINLNKDLKGATLDILTDSRAALRAHTCDSFLVWDCITNLMHLAGDNQVTLWWIPRYEGIKGNVEADKLAKKGASTLPIGPEPWCGVTASYIKKLIRNWEERQKSSYCSGTTGLAQAKKFILYTPQITRDALSLTKGDLAILVGLLSGHCQHRYYLSIIGKAEDDGCRFCMESAKIAEHIMYSCPAIGHLRQKFMEESLVTPDQIRVLEPRQVAWHSTRASTWSEPE